MATQSETVGEKPVDYSLKYKDDNTVDDNINKSQHHCVSAVNAATDNAEHHGHHLHQHHNLTVEELDTPTDYSLKYHEEESKTHDYNLIVRYGQQPDVSNLILKVI